MNLKRMLVLLSTLMVVAAVFAQRVTESVQVTLVEVPVTVVDKDGNAVRGLTAQNFELYDDGKRVPIEYFETLDLSATAPAVESDEPLPRAATRHFLLLFDLANSSPGTIRRAAEAAKEFVATQLGARDFAAVSTFTAEAGARVITNFTQDRALLTDAIETLGHPKYFKPMDPLMVTAARQTTGGGSDGGPGMRGEIGALYEEMMQERQREVTKTDFTEMRNRLRIQFTNLEKLARVLDSLHGQKQIILLSEGFDAVLVTGREQLSSDEAKLESTNVMTGEVWKVDNDKRFGNTASANELNEMAELFRRSDVVLHAIDIKGLRGSTDPASATASGGKTAEALHLITRPTGGTVFKNTNDIAATFARMMKQQEVVYLIGFQAKSSGKPGKFHTLKVKSVNTKSARVSHRPGYYESGTRVSDLERALTLGEIMLTDAPVEDVRINLGVTTLPGPGGKARTPVVVEIPSSGLLKDLSGRKANAQLLLYAFNEKGQAVDHLMQRIGIDLDASGDAIAKGGVRYYGSLRLPPGKYALKALVRVDETGLIGFKREELVVPTFNEPTVMQPVVFEEPQGWAMLFGPTRGDDYAYPFAAGEAKYIPKSEPEIAAGTEQKVALFLFRMPIENLSVTPTILSADGASQAANVKLLGRTSADDRGSVKLLFSFQPPQLAAGRHELRFAVTSKDGTQSQVSLPFIMR